MEETKHSRDWRAVWVRSGLLLLGILLLVFVAKTRGDWSLARQTFDTSGRTDTNEFTMAYAKWGTFIAAFLNGVILLFLAATGKWWLDRNPGVDVKETKVAPASKICLGVLAIALVVGGWLRWDRADVSFYNDEAHTFRRYVAGEWRNDKKGELKWFQVSWLKTMFYNQVGNNSTPCSALARVSYETWSKATKAEPGAVNERAVRFPTIVASLGAIVFLWLLARRLISNEAAGWVALLSAGHFWMVRYGNEARGYGLTLLAISAMFYFIHRALEANKWRWWIAMGLAQFLCLWAFTGAVYFVMVLDILILIERLWSVKKKRVGKAAFWRPFVGMILGAMLTLQLMVPTLPQLVAAVNALDSMHGRMGAEWWEDLGSGLSAGLPWKQHGEVNPNFIGMAGPIGLAMELLTALLVVVGIAALISAKENRKFVIWMAAASFGAILLSWAMMSSNGMYLHYWYVIYALPALLLLLTGAMAWAKARWLVGGLLSAVLAFHGHAFLLQRGNTKEEIKPAVLLVRDGTPAASNRLIGRLFSDADVYDKNTVLVKDMKGLDDLIGVAKSTGKELWIIYTRRATMAVQMPEILNRLENAAEFERVQEFHGNDETLFSQHVVKLKP